MVAGVGSDWSHHIRSRKAEDMDSHVQITSAALLVWSQLEEGVTYTQCGRPSSVKPSRKRLLDTLRSVFCRTAGPFESMIKNHPPPSLSSTGLTVQTPGLASYGSRAFALAPMHWPVTSPFVTQRTACVYKKIKRACPNVSWWFVVMSTYLFRGVYQTLIDGSALPCTVSCR